MRILLTIEYRGTNYHGWQRQKDKITIAQVIEDTIFNLTGQNVTLAGAGRTDAGVHAYAMRAHFDIDFGMPPQKYAFALSNALPPDIKIRQSIQVKDDFHSRFDAVSKTYLYKIFNADYEGALNYDTHYSVTAKLDIGKMRECAQYFLGTHDFCAFKSSGNNPASTVRTITRLSISENVADGGFGKEIIISITGNSFLYNMVRIIAAQIIRVGREIIKPEDIKAMILSKKRKNAREIAPARGLYLYEIDYGNMLI